MTTVTKVTPSKEDVKAILLEKKFYQHQFSESHMVYIELTDACYHDFGDLKHVTIGCGEIDYGDHTPDICWQVFGQYYFSEADLDKAIDSFVTQISSENPLKKVSIGQSLKYINIKTKKQLLHSSHYDYGSEVAGIVLHKLKALDTDDLQLCKDVADGIMYAHGDKMYQYKDGFEQGNVPFYHGVVLQVLSYTKVYGNNVRQDLVKWVVENYPKYKEVILETEKQVLYEKYGVVPENIIGPC